MRTSKRRAAAVRTSGESWRDTGIIALHCARYRLNAGGVYAIDAIRDSHLRMGA